MLLALLGTDSDSLALAAAAIGEGHQIVWLGDVRPEDADLVRNVLPGLTDRAAQWELVLDRGTADAVIVGRGTSTAELRAEQLKRLAAEAAPTLAVHPACDSVLPYYEIDMTRRETGSVVRHYNPVADHPVYAEMIAWVRDGHPTIGPIHQVTCERRLADNSRASVERALACDVEPLCAIAGDIRRTSAVGPNIHQASFASLQVQMIGAGPASARWSVSSSGGAEAGMVLTLVGERGTVSLFAPESPDTAPPQPWKLETVGAGERQTEELEPFDAPRIAIQQLEQAVAETDGERRHDWSTWDTATRDMEIVDAIELSLEKGRMIDVHKQQLTEQLAFRGTMSAIGCGLLVVGFLVFFIVSLFGAAEGNDARKLIPAWPKILLAVLAFFLLLQFAPLLILGKKTGRNASTANPRSDTE